MTTKTGLTKPLKKDVPEAFCKSKCCAYRAGKCHATSEGPGLCLFDADIVETAKRQGLK